MYLGKRYVYYGCTDSKRTYCKNPYIREEELINQLIQIIDAVDVNEIGMRHKFEDEVRRYHKFQKDVLGISENIEPKNQTDIRTYAKYILREGSNEEKRELLSMLKGKILLTEKEIQIS